MMHHDAPIYMAPTPAAANAAGLSHLLLVDYAMQHSMTDSYPFMIHTPSCVSRREAGEQLSNTLQNILAGRG